MGNAENLSLGPGKLYVAPLGTDEPADLTAPWPTGWKEVGYTDEGSQFEYQYETDAVTVAEELDPVFYRTTGRNGNVSFAMAENTARNLTIAFNGGTVTVAGTEPNQVVTYEPPAPGEEVRRMIGFESEDGEERWVWRQCFQSGNVSVARKNGADKATIPVEMRIEKPANGAKPFKVLYSINRKGDAA